MHFVFLLELIMILDAYVSEEWRALNATARVLLSQESIP